MRIKQRAERLLDEIRTDEHDTTYYLRKIFDMIAELDYDNDQMEAIWENDRRDNSQLSSSQKSESSLALKALQQPNRKDSSMPAGVVLQKQLASVPKNSQGENNPCGCYIGTGMKRIHVDDTIPIGRSIDYMGRCTVCDSLMCIREKA